MTKQQEVKQGDRYGYYEIKKQVKSRYGMRYFLCICQCGKEKEIRLSTIIKGESKSCGCVNKEYLKDRIIKINKTHGMSRTRIYHIWQDMKNRCDNPTVRAYKDYGKRGIIYDPKWKSFEGFYEDMKEGYTPNLTIERENNNGNYTKNNCKWATMKEQCVNKRNTIKINGKTLIEIAIQDKVNINTLRSRYRKSLTLT